jgi:4-hydroxy 2-oxovalerate aldolase
MSKNKLSEFSVLETTLRDGSYAVNFQFSAAETELLAGLLEKAGMTYIEIGHGVGLNASNTAGQGTALATDEEYLLAASKSVKNALYGMFCIPGIARLEDIDLCADCGAGFIRIGSNVTEVKEARPFYARAKKTGMLVAANFMKSYAMSPEGFADMVVIAEDGGADIVYIVDSAGGMLPDDIDAYFSAIREKTDIPLGFHGHNNVHMAIANSLKAMELGAVLIDSSLQGLGRGAGNAATEVLVALLNQKGIKNDFDFLKLCDIGDEYIKDLLPNKGLDSIDIVTGTSLFHSSYMGLIKKYSLKYRIDPRLLIAEVGKVEQISPTDTIVGNVAEKLASNTHKPFTKFHRMDRYFGHEQDV